MYFPSVLQPQITSVRTVLRYPDGGTCMVVRDTFDVFDTIEHMINYVLKTTPDNRVIQEMKIIPPSEM